jgi:hypothetical protein
MTTSFDQTPANSNTSERASSFVRTSGRTRKAGYWICGAGIAVILSAFLPWVSVEGMAASHPQGGSVAVLLVIGGLLAYFGTRVLSGRLSRALTVGLWVLSAVDVFISVANINAASKLQNEGAGIVSVTPAVGFYVGIGGLLASVIGTVLVQSLRRKHAVGGQPTRRGH